MSNAKCQLDHLVVTARHLADGIAWTESALGVTLERGGEHARMGTHNALLRLGHSVYLEVIAPNPAAQTPARHRWFDLDGLDPGAVPRLATFVARCDDIRLTIQGCDYRYGLAEEMSRGRFSWLITIPPDGALPGGGAIPTLIQWTIDDQPAKGLRDQGCRLSQLEVFTSESTSTSELLGCLGLRDAVEVRDLSAGSQPYLIATIDTPNGAKFLGPRTS